MNHNKASNRKEKNMNRIAQFSIRYDCNESGDQDLVINAGSSRGFTVRVIDVNWEPHAMTGSSNELPYLEVAKYTGSGSGGTAAVIFSHTDGDIAAASALLSPTTLGSNEVDGPSYWPGVASYTDNSTWYLHGGRLSADFSGAEIYVATNNSFWLRIGNAVQATVYLYESLTP